MSIDRMGGGDAGYSARRMMIRTELDRGRAEMRLKDRELQMENVSGMLNMAMNPVAGLVGGIVKTLMGGLMGGGGGGLLGGGGGGLFG